MLKNLPGSGEVLRGVTDNPNYQIFYDSITNITDDYTEIDIPILAERIGIQYLDDILITEQWNNFLIHYVPPEFIPDYIFSRFSVLFDLQNWVISKHSGDKFGPPGNAPKWFASETEYPFRSKLYKKTISVPDLLVNLSNVEKEYERLSVDEKNQIYQNIITYIRVGKVKKYESMENFYMDLAILYSNFTGPIIPDWNRKMITWLDRTMTLQYQVDPLDYVYTKNNGCVDPYEGIINTPVINIKKCGKFTPTQLKSISKYISSVGAFTFIPTANKHLEKMLRYMMAPIFTSSHIHLDAPDEFEQIRREFINKFKYLETFREVEESNIASKMILLRDSGKVLPGWKDKESFNSDLFDIIVHTNLGSVITSFMKIQLNKIKETARAIGRKLREDEAAESERKLLSELAVSKPRKSKRGVRPRRGQQVGSVGKEESVTPPTIFTPSITFAPSTTFAPVSDPGYEQSCKYPFSEGKQEDIDNDLMTWLRQSFSHYKLDRRVTRWRNNDPNVIRTFKDKDVFKYDQLSDSEIYLKRLYHHLPGTDLLLNNKAYSFDTPTGKGLIVTILRNGNQDDGVIYFGIGSNGVIFHRFFEPPDDDIEQIMGHTYPIIRDDSNDTDWECNDLYVISINDEGIVLINYPDEDYEVRIYPIRDDFIPFQ